MKVSDRIDGPRSSIVAGWPRCPLGRNPWKRASLQLRQNLLVCGVEPDEGQLITAVVGMYGPGLRAKRPP